MHNFTSEQFAKLRHRCRTDHEFFIREVLTKGLASEIFPEVFGEATAHRTPVSEGYWPEGQRALKEQLAISAELGDIQTRLHTLIETLLDRRFLTRAQVRQLFKALDPTIACLILDLQKFVTVNGTFYEAPAIDVS